MTAVDTFESFARFYDLFYAGRDDDLRMYRDFALAADGPILELGCGTGRALVPLAREGHHVTGLDASEAMLTLAQTKVKEYGLDEQVTLVRGDMCHFDLSTRFALVMIPINTFMHCSDINRQLACLQCIRRHLRPEGRLIVDVYHPDPQVLLEADGRLFGDAPLTDPETGHLIQRFHTRQLDLASQTQHVTFIMDEIDSAGTVRRTTFPFDMRFVYRYEMELLLRMTGFSLEDVYGSYDLEPFESDSEKMIFVAKAVT
jgi:SAM-dependent methyltransferase